MSVPGLHHITVQPLHADPAPLGIKTVPGTENATYQMREGRLWKEIGTTYVFADDRITVVHVADAAPHEIALLTGHAEDVWRGTIVPTKATAWHFWRRSDRPNYWFTNLLAPADALHYETAARVEAARIPTSLTKMLADDSRHVVEADERAVGHAAGGERA